MYAKYEKVVQKVSDIAFYISAIATAGMMLLGFVDVMLRLVFKNPIVGATEMVLVMFLCIPAAMAKVALGNEFTMVDIVVDKVFPRALRRVVNLVTVFVSMVFCAAVCYQFIIATIDSYQMGVTYSLAKIPEWPFQAVMAFSFFALTLALPIMMKREWDKDAPGTELEVKPSEEVNNHE